MIRGIEKFGYVYILTNKNKTVLYIGVTNNLVRRIYEHKNHIFKNSFTDKYNCEYCIYYEEFVYFDLAIAREKELKKWNRQKKEALINKKNPEWKELVTECGFVRTAINDEILRFAALNDNQINDEILRFAALNDDQINDEILRFAQNDGGVCDNKGEEGGGEAAAFLAPSSIVVSVIPNGAKRNEESDDKTIG
ncbi:hypothetical protein AGMMS50239_05500 [Bacteroidia bacterium]|nr:hypothetical protein AGMMS50239_05500 [Bacteroidia bacterium]